MRKLITSMALVSLAWTAHAQPAPPDPPWRANLEAMHRAILAGDLRKAKTLADGLTKAEPRLRAAWEVLAADEVLSNGSPSDETRHRLAAPLPSMPKAAKPAEGDRLHVMATALRVRAKPSRRGKVLGTLPINTQVEVTSVRRGWVGIKASLPPEPSKELLFGVDARPGSKPREVSGFTKWKFLVPAPLDATKLIADADALVLHSRPADALPWYQKALFMDPANEGLRRKLAYVALDALRYELAYRTMADLQDEAERAPGEPNAKAFQAGETSVYFGCRGDKSRAKTVFPDDKAPRDACLVVDEVISECSPRDPFSGSYHDAASYCDDPENWAGGTREDCEAELEGTQAQLDEEHAYWEKEARSFMDELEKHRAAFPGKGWVQFQVFFDPNDPRNKGVELFAFAVPYSVRICQDYEMSFNLARAEVTRYGIPMIAVPGSRENMLEVWVESPATTSFVIGLIAAKDRDAALAKLSAHPECGMEEQDASECAPMPNVALPTPRCHCESEAYTE